MKLGLGILAFTVSVLALAPALAFAETRAIVVGASGYPNLNPSLRLQGPRNDSREVIRTIVDLGVKPGNITVLADGIGTLPDGVAPSRDGTKAAILEALETAERESQPGDLVFFFFSGHGSQQPDLNGDEQGSNDEIFLPYDAGGWSGTGVANALVDDELDERIQKLLDKGVDFFGMIDACNSATGFRSAPNADAVSRYVDPAELGVPATAVAIDRGFTPPPANAKPGRGRAAYFYAAQEIEEALEITPKGAEEGEYYGVFTYNVLKRLRQTPNLTYRTLHQAVVNDIKRGSMMQTQTPAAEGELLDEPVLRLGDARPLRQWPIFAGRVQGGELDGLVPGTVVALFDDPAASDADALAHGVVETTGATKALVTPLTWPCAQADADGKCTVAPDEVAFKKGKFARIVEPGLDFTLTLSEPVRIDPNDGHDYSRAVSALDAAVSAPALGARAAVAKSGYDVAVGLVDGKLAFSGAAGLVDPHGPGSSPRLTLSADPATAATEVEGAVKRMAKALALQRLAGATDGGTSLGLVPHIRVAKAKPSAVVDGKCSENDGDYESPVPAGDQPTFDDCDILSVVLDNTGKKPVDVTVLLVGTDFSITPVWPLDGTSNRIQFSEKKTADILQMEPDPAASGEERLVFIGVPGINRAHVAFDDLAQEGVRAVDDPLSPAAAAMRDLLADEPDGMTRAGATGQQKLSEELSVEVRPFLVRKGGRS